MQSKVWTGILVVLCLVGCQGTKEEKYPTSINNYSVKLDTQDTAFSWGVMMASEEALEAPFVAVVEGSVQVVDKKFTATDLQFNVLGGEVEAISELALNGNQNTYEGEYQLTLRDSATYETQTAIENVKTLIEIPSIHIHAIKNLENQNCEFIYLSRKNKLTYPDGMCRVNLRYEQNDGANESLTLRVQVRVVNDDELAISILP